LRRFWEPRIVRAPDGDGIGRPRYEAEMGTVG
jgi:hypothetical protein